MARRSTVTRSSNFLTLSFSCGPPSQAATRERASESVCVSVFVRECVRGREKERERGIERERERDLGADGGGDVAAVDRLAVVELLHRVVAVPDHADLRFQIVRS